MIRRRLLLVVAGLVLGLAAGELAARLILPRLPDPAGTAWMKDPACGFRLRPTVPGELPEDHDDFINARGFRDRNHPALKPAGTFRVLGIGDSFVYGAVPARENFLRLAVSRLNERMPDLAAEVLLLGAPGYSPEHETALLQTLGLGLQPDLVILNFFVGNDITGIPVRGKVIKGRMYFTHSPMWWLNLARRSQFFQLAEGAFYRGWQERRSADALSAAMRPVTAPGGAGGAPLDRGPVSDIYLQMVRHDLPVYCALPGDRLQALWDEAEGYLERLDRLCRQAGVPWLLVLIPGQEQVDLTVRAQVLAGLGLDPAAYDFEAPQQRLQRWAEKHQVRVLDLLPALRSAHRDADPLYIPDDTHWNTRGNAVAGRCLGDTLVADLAAGLDGGPGAVLPGR